MDILLNDRGLELLNESYDEALSEEERQSVVELTGLDPDNTDFYRVNIGPGADVMTLLAVWKGIKTVTKLVFSAAEVQEHFGNVIKKIKEFITTRQLESIDEDAAKIIAMDYLIHNFDCNQLRLVSSSMTVGGNGGSCKEFEGHSITDTPHRYYLFSYELNGLETVILGIKSYGEIEVVKAFDFNPYGITEINPNINGMAITYKYNGREIEGIEEFYQEVEQYYPCFGEDVWIPSGSEGGEFWFTVFADVKFQELVESYDKDIFEKHLYIGDKTVSYAPFLDALLRLRTANIDKWKLKIRKASFKFQDREIVIGGLSDDELMNLGVIFKAIAQEEELIQSDGGFEIKSIELPAEQLPSNGKWEIDQWRFDIESIEGCKWLITYRDFSKALFDSRSKELKEL